VFNLKYKSLGKSGINASVVAYGAWAIGGWMWGGTEEKEAIESIHAALDSGINFFDTAPIYGFGTSEMILGKSLKGKRDKAIIATKLGMVWDTDKGNYAFSSDQDSIKKDKGSIRVHKYLGRDSVRKEVEASLKRLNTDYIDLYQTHWQDSTTPIEETMDELCKLRDEGKIRAIGVCNVNLEQLDKYSSVGQVDTDQEKYSLLDRELEDYNLKYSDENKLGFLAYSPMANGLLTGKVSTERVFPDGDLRNNKKRFSIENRKKVIDTFKLLDSLKEKYNATYTQLILAWTLHQKGCSHVLAGSRNVIQVQENAKAGIIDFDKSDINVFNDVVEILGEI
jgi:aryl-alcohol dehydrogenase-like predicted oxidoreductase